MKIQKIYLLLLLFCSWATFSFGQNKLSKGDHFANINGVRLHYYVSGKGPVCLCPSPGWGPSINYLKLTMQPMENYFTIVYYDTRISGQSSGPADTTKYTSNDFMDDMDGLRNYLQQEKVWIMGHSAGGFQVMYYGIHHNDKLNGMIVLDGAAGRDSLQRAEMMNIVSKRKDLPYYQRGLDLFSGKDTTQYSTKDLLKIIMPFYFHDFNKMKEFLQLNIGEMSEKAGIYTSAANFGTEYLFPDLNKITVPTLVVVGDDDFICDKVSQADRITKNIASADEIVIKNAGHFCWFEQPQQFFHDCSKWLEKQGIKKQN